MTMLTNIQNRYLHRKAGFKYSKQCSEYLYVNKKKSSLIHFNSLIEEYIVLLSFLEGSKPVLESFSDIQCVFLEDSRRHCIFL